MSANAAGRVARSVKRALRRLVMGSLRIAGVPMLMRRTSQRRGVTVLAYHDPDPAAFDRHLRVLRSLYSVISPESYLDAVRDGTLGALPDRALVITLDDGWAGNRALIPVLEKHGVRPAVFVCTQIVGTTRRFWWTYVSDEAEQERMKLLQDEERLSRLRVMSAQADGTSGRQALSLDEMREMTPAVSFQAHTRTHPILPRCADDVARSEIAGCADDLERLLGTRPRAFAYPNGDASARDVELVRRAGFECAFTVETGTNDGSTDPWRLHRIFIHDDAGTAELIACASGAYGRLVRLLRGRPARAEG